MGDIIRATADNNMIRIFIADTKDIVQKACQKHNTSPVISALLGRSLTAGAIMGAMLKDETDLINIKIKGDGEAKGVFVMANNKTVKGYPLNPFVDIPLNKYGKLDVKGAIGKGKLTIIKDLGLKQPYVGEVPLISGEIAEDFTYYFAKSEQVPSSVSLGVLVDRDYSIKRAGGFIIQLMPGVNESTITNLEQKLKNIKPFTTMQEEGSSLQDILNILFNDLNLKILDKTNIFFKCNCSKERVIKALIAIGKKELENIIKEDKKAMLNCHFCNESYFFSEDELIEILKNM